ncbi:MAG: galactose-1-phosphate uridylyltransferase [Candidatus Odinarchaeia archaeon]
MPQIRQDYITDNKVIIAQIRAKRPRGKPEKMVSKEGEFCPFCPENQSKLAPAKAAYFINKENQLASQPESDDQKVENWIIKVLDNLYPVFTQEEKKIENTNKYTTEYSAYGIHEVIIDSPLHNDFFHNMKSDKVINLFKVYRDRFEILSKLDKINYVSISKNHGPSSGGTLLHPHSQIIASTFLPERIQVELDNIKKNGSCSYEEIINIEKNSLRFIIENKSTIAFCPFASITPYEVWVFPKAHVNNLTKLNDKDFEILALTVRDITRAISNIVDQPSYNLVFNQTIKEEEYHMYIRIIPRFYYETGFEINLGMPVNEVAPETAASEIREFFSG